MSTNFLMSQLFVLQQLINKSIIISMRLMLVKLDNRNRSSIATNQDNNKLKPI